MGWSQGNCLIQSIFLLVEQNARMALQVASRGYVIQTGVVVLSDSAENLQKNEMVRKAYMGEN